MVSPAYIAGLDLRSWELNGDIEFYSCYNYYMKKKPLIETNPYLKDAETRRKLIARSVATSCGVEGIKTGSKSHIQITQRTAKRIYKSS